MAYRWTAEPTDVQVPELEQRWDDQQQAEAWFAENWGELADAGVASVTLWEEDRLVYGPMSLDEA